MSYSEIDFMSKGEILRNLAASVQHRKMLEDQGLEIPAYLERSIQYWSNAMRKLRYEERNDELN